MMVVLEKKIGNATVKIDDSYIQKDTKRIIKNLETIISNGLARQEMKNTRYEHELDMQ